MLQKRSNRGSKQELLQREVLIRRRLFEAAVLKMTWTTLNLFSCQWLFKKRQRRGTPVAQLVGRASRVLRLSVLCSGCWFDSHLRPIC